MSPPVGPTGLATTCSGEERAWRAGASYGFTSTDLRFSTSRGDVEGSLVKHAIVASLERRFGDRMSGQLALGATLAGSFDVLGASHALLAGPLGAIAISYRVVDEKRSSWVPFVILGGAFGVARSLTRAPDGAPFSMTGIDARLSAIAGKTIADVLSPYLVARAFGGPVLWHLGGEDVTGTDTHHYQLGAGAALRVGAFDLLLEGVPLGERALAAGAGFSF